MFSQQPQISESCVSAARFSLSSECKFFKLLLYDNVSYKSNTSHVR